jgi:protoporphyrinogen oxidase
MENKKELIVVGGGITGLSIAYIAAKSGYKVTVLEGGNNFGGLLNTFSIGNNNLEHFYHHFFTHDAEIHWLINDLGLSDRLFFKKTRMGVFRNKKIYNFNSPADLLKFSPITLSGKFKFALTSFYLGKFADWKKFESISALAWFYKRAGKNVTESLWKPLLDIKFGPYASKVPLAWMVGRLRQRMSSRKKGEEQLGYLNGSLQILLDALLSKLNEAGVQMICGESVEELIISNNEIKGVKTKGRTVYGDKVVLTIPSPFSAKLLEPHDKALSEKIGATKYFGAVCTILELDRKLSDIYWLNVADEGFPFGGIIEHTNFISEKNYDGKHLVYLSRYFAHEEEIAHMTPQQIKELMVPPLSKIYKDFDMAWIKKVHVFRTNTAATICDMNFSEKVVEAKLPVKNLYLANMMHIYPDERSVNNSIRLAAEVCRIMGIPSDFVPKGSSMSAQIGFNN